VSQKTSHYNVAHGYDLAHKLTSRNVDRFSKFFHGQIH